MNRNELATSITRLTIAWSEGDRESAEIQFCSVIRGLKTVVGACAGQWDDRAAVDVLTAVYAGLRKTRSQNFENRQAFLRAYIEAMTHWLSDRRRSYAGKRMGFGWPTGTQTPAAGALLDLDDRLDRLRARNEIDNEDARLFTCNRVLGVPQADLAELYCIGRRSVAERIRRVSRLLGNELADGMVGAVSVATV